MIQQQALHTQAFLAFKNGCEARFQSFERRYSPKTSRKIQTVRERKIAAAYLSFVMHGTKERATQADRKDQLIW